MGILIVAIIIVVLILSYWQVAIWMYPARVSVSNSPPYPQFELVTFESEDNLNITGWYAPPQNGYTILIMHGFNANRNQLIHHSEYLLPEGYGILTFDFRNHGTSEGNVTSMGFHELKDARAAYRYLQEQPETDNVILWGHSMGGAIATQLMAEVDATGLFIDATFAEFPSIVRAGTQLRGLPATPVTEIVTTMYAVLTQSNWTQMRPVDKIKDIEKPMLFFHGTNDLIIPISEAYDFVNANPNIQLEVFAGGSHGDLYALEPDRYRKEVLAYLEQITAE